MTKSVPNEIANYLLAGLARFFFALGVKGAGGLFSKRRSTSFSDGAGSGCLSGLFMVVA